MIKQRKFDAIQPVTVKLQSEIFKAFFLELQTLRLNELIINRAGDIQLFVIPFLGYKGGGSVNSQLYQPQLIRGLDLGGHCALGHHASNRTVFQRRFSVMDL